MNTLKVKVLKNHPLLSHEVGEEVVLQELSAKQFADAGVVELLEKENAKAKPQAETPEKSVKK